MYQYDSTSTATRNGKLVLNTGGTGRLIAIGGVVYDPVTGKIIIDGLIEINGTDNRLLTGDISTSLEQTKQGFENYNSAFTAEEPFDDFQYTDLLTSSHATLIRNETVAGGGGSIEFDAYISTPFDGFIGVDGDSSYYVEYSIKHPTTNTGNGSRNYLGLRYYDADKLEMQSWMASLRAGTRTVLAQDFNSGDNKVYLDGDITGSIYDSTSTSNRRLNFWKLRDNGLYAYEGMNGKQYEQYGYTREYIVFVYNSAVYDPVNDWTVFDVESNTENFSFLAGTAVAQGGSWGGTYVYWIGPKVTTTLGSWVNYKSTVLKGECPADYAGGVFKNDGYALPNGASYVKIFGLWAFRDGNGGTFDNGNDKLYLGKVGLKKTTTVATDNAIPKFDGTQGILQNSNIIISDNNELLINGATGAQIAAKGSTSDNSAYTIKLENSNGDLGLSLRGDNQLYHSGSFVSDFDEITTDTTLTNSAKRVIILNPSAAGMVVTLPANPEGQEYIFENVSAFNVTIARNGNNIDGSVANKTITNGSNWHVKWFDSTIQWRT